jgi:DNA-binding CsgD family transcriptional regulator
MNDITLESIERKLNIMLKLLAQSSLPEASQKEKIAFLSSMDLKPKEIAEILGTTSNTVNVALSRLRAQNK